MSSRNQANPITSRDVEDMLQRHSEALASGQDIAPELIEQNPQVEPKVRGLLGLNRQLSESLPQVEPSGSYVSSLKERLSEAYSVAREEQERHARQMRARIGTGVGALIVIGLLVRVLGSIIMIITFVARSRRRSTELKTTS